MRLTFFILLLTFTSMKAQEVTSDSTYIASESGVWFRFTVLTYVNGNSNIAKTLIGDTLTVFNQTVDAIRNESNRLASDVAITSNYDRTALRTIRNANDVLLKIGRSPVDSIEKADLQGFLGTGWTVRTPTEVRSITFNNNNGRLRYQYGDVSNKQTELMGSVLVLRNFPIVNESTVFYRTPNGGRWLTLNRNFILIPPGGTSNRD